MEIFIILTLFFEIVIVLLIIVKFKFYHSYSQVGVMVPLNTINSIRNNNENTELINAAVPNSDTELRNINSNRINE